MKKIKIRVETTQVDSFEGLIMVEFWLWKLILKEFERINKSGVSIKLWFSLINDIKSLIEELISLET
jgi:hypothetical protein